MNHRYRSTFIDVKEDSREKSVHDSAAKSVELCKSQPNKTGQPWGQYPQPKAQPNSTQGLILEDIHIIYCSMRKNHTI